MEYLSLTADEKSSFRASSAMSCAGRVLMKGATTTRSETEELWISKSAPNEKICLLYTSDAADD